MINIAILGYGVVGSGVVEVINKNSKSIARKAGEEIRVKYIVDIKEIQDNLGDIIITKNGQDAIDDKDVSVIVETIGGIGFAYQFTKNALQAGKHVVTSNKELVATHGPELLDTARQNNVNYLFEASVGGGIPIIRPLSQCLAANEIYGIMGILNGTTNYILTKMNKENVDFGTALKSAQANGYAEADPTADIEGYDACRKIAILSSISYGQYVDYKKIPTDGISKITPVDMKYADEMDHVIKLIAMSREMGGRIYARVSPAMISKKHPLANVEDVFNGILVRGNAIGDVMFYGRGAGKLPTASAVVADVIDVVKHIDKNNRNRWIIKQEENMVDPEEYKTKHFVRVRAENPAQVEELAGKHFGQAAMIKLHIPGVEDEIAFVTGDCSDREVWNAAKKLLETGGVKEIMNIIRILGDD